MADLSAKGRRQAAQRGAAMDDGSFPIYTRDDLDKAIRAVGRARPDTEARRAAVRRHIIKRARALGLMKLIPDTWNSDGTLKS